MAALPVVTLVGGQRRASVLRWGLAPLGPLPRRATTGQRIVRREDLGPGRPADAVRFVQRCLVPVDGFDIWRHASGQIDRFTVAPTHPDHMLALAGVWRPAADGGRFAVVTTLANERLAPIHDRMPAVLDRDLWTAWLSAGAEVPPLLPYPADRLTVSRLPPAGPRSAPAPAPAPAPASRAGALAGPPSRAR